MKKRFSIGLLIAFVLFMLVSCNSFKEVTYEEFTSEANNVSEANYTSASVNVSSSGDIDRSSTTALRFYGENGTYNFKYSNGKWTIADENLDNTKARTASIMLRLVGVSIESELLYNSASKATKYYTGNNSFKVDFTFNNYYNVSEEFNGNGLLTRCDAVLNYNESSKLKPLKMTVTISYR